MDEDLGLTEKQIKDLTKVPLKDKITVIGMAVMLILFIFGGVFVAKYIIPVMARGIATVVVGP